MPNGYKNYDKNLIGQRHGKLTVIKKDSSGRSRWICRCDCGNTVTLLPSRFFKRLSCGCLEEENRRNIGERSKTHGMTNTILYSKYCSMKERCHNENYIYYMRYGGRGIKICEEWENSFEAFVKWAYENGYDDTKVGYEQSLDRIDNDKDYCPENCRWVDQKMQVKNRGIATHIIYNGEDLNYTEFSKKYGIDSEAFVRRHYESGQDPEDIIKEWRELHDDKYFSIGEASEYYGIPVNKLRQLAYTNKMDAIKVGFFWRFKKPQSA